MAPKFDVVLKRHMPQENIHRKRDRKKRKRVFYNSSTEDLDSSEGVKLAAMNYREPTMYDILLTSLGLSNKIVAGMKKRRSLDRQREEEGKSDTEGDEDEENSRSKEDQSCIDGEDDEIPGADHETLVALTKNTEEECKDNEEEDSEYCETDNEHDLSINSRSSVSTSAFSEHLTHKLSSEEVAQSDPTYGLKPKLFKHWLQLYEKSGGKDFDSSSRRRFFSMCNSYLDILHSNKRPFYKRGHGEDSSHMDAYLMHSIYWSQFLKTKDHVQKNESKIAKHCEEEALSDDRFRDKDLLVQRSIAFRVVNRLIQLTPESQRINVQNVSQFSDKFGCNGDGNHVKTSKKGNQKNLLIGKPFLIGEGNADDTIMLGIKYTRKSITLDTSLDNNFCSSNMIIASPVELVMAIGRAEENKDENVDYLSSIEVLVIDHADVLSMQSWRNLDIVVKQLNRMPSELHGTNIMRVRLWYLDEHAQFYRQSIILSSYLTTEMNSLFNQLCLNYKGEMKLECEYEGVLKKVLSSVIQVYERFDADSMMHVDNARLECFAKKVFPRIRDSVQGGVMIFSNSRLDLVRIREFLRSQKASFCVLDEQTTKEGKTRARQAFISGGIKIMLYTERAYFFLEIQGPWHKKVDNIFSSGEDGVLPSDYERA